MSTGKELKIVNQTDLFPSNPNKVPSQEYTTDQEYELLLTETWKGLESANRNGDSVEIVKIAKEQATRMVAYWQLRLAQFKGMPGAPMSVEPHLTHFGELEKRATWETSYNNETLRLHIVSQKGVNYRATLSRGLSEDNRNSNEIDLSFREALPKIGKDYDGISFIVSRDGVSFESIYLNSLIGGDGKYIFKTKSRIHILNGRIQSFKREEYSKGEVDGSSAHTDFKGEISLSMPNENEEEYVED